ncbi:MAG: glucokinase [Rhodospirillales bacterium]
MSGLIADIGGTNARFGMVGDDGITRQVLRLACRDFPTLVDACRHYLTHLGAAEPPRAGAIAVASPVSGDEVKMTNHIWSFSVEETRRQLGFDTLNVINDFVAIALSLPHLFGDDVVKVGTGEALPHGAIGVLGPGTGLGVSAMIPTGLGWTPLTSEGGHVTAPAFDDREAAVLAAVRRHRLRSGKDDHVSAERVISGPGLVNLYQAIAEVDGVAVDPAITPPECTRRAIDGSCPIAVNTVAMFSEMLGTIAANLALTLNARGGIYIAGGIVPQLGETFVKSGFRARFEDKGRFGGYLQSIPTWVVVEPLPAFVGLATLVGGRAAVTHHLPGEISSTTSAEASSASDGGAK